VAGAGVRAHLAAAALALEAAEALALADLAVADAAGGALGVLVGLAVLVGGINPRELVGAEA
jgi:hypothetical protein